MTALSTSFRNVTIGIENDCIVSAPPIMPTRSENSVSSGVISTAAMMRGVTRKRTGLKPIVVRASTSWLTRIVPISAAKAAPERPASRIAVISGPSSRSIDRPIRSATKISAPKRFIGTADWNARIMPSRNEISATIGSASTPTCSQMRQTSFQRTLRGWRAAIHERRGRLADELDLRPDVAPEAEGGEPDLLDRRPARRLRIEVVLEDARVELLQQRLRTRA